MDGIHVICAGVLTIVPANPALTARFIGNRVEWREGWDLNPRFRFSTVYSSVGQNFDAKLRNALQRWANAALPEYLASATICKAVKRCVTR